MNRAPKRLKSWDERRIHVTTDTLSKTLEITIRYKGMVFRGFLAFVVAFLLSTSSSAGVLDPLSSQELVTRCFSVFGLRLSPKDQRRAQISNLAAARSLCSDLIDSPKIFASSGFISTSKSRITPEEAQKVARRMQQFHESFFKNDDFGKVLEDFGFARMLYDPTLAPAYFTWAFLKDDFRLAVTESSMLRLLRDNSLQSPVGNLRRQSQNENFISPQETALQVHDPRSFSEADPFGILLRGVDRGLLRGFKLTSPEDPVHFMESSSRSPQNSHSNDSLLWQRTLGAGYLGEPGFLLLNLGLQYDERTDGAVKMPRRWAHELMNTALCKKGPYLKANQVPDVSLVTNPGTSVPGFRRDTDCLRCHVNSDPLASSLRNLSITHLQNVNAQAPAGWLSGSVQLSGFHHFIRRYEGETNSFGSSTWRSTPFDGFYKQSGPAQLNYTSAMDGNYRSFSIPIHVGQDSSAVQLQDLGEKIADEDDYYFCGLTRYFSLISGIQFESDVDHFPNLPSGSSALYQEMWSYLKALAPEFKANPSPKWAIKKLIESEYFLSRSFKRFQTHEVQISSISPSAGTVDGGTPITIEGSNFSATSQVFFGDQLCGVTSWTETTLVCASPALPIGSADLNVTVQVVDGPASDTLEGTFNYQIEPQLTHIRNFVFTPHCASCHHNGNSTLNLENPSHSALLSHGGLITPQNPTGSELYKRVTGASLPQMPQGGPYLSDGLQESIRLWIQNGAEDN
jgi:hypothetical protein